MYNDYNDHELLYMICESSEDAMNIMYEKYKSIIELKATKYRTLGIRVGLEYNDLVQEGMVGLIEAIRSYKDNKETKFASFANICIERQILSVLSYARRKKHYYLNDSCSLDSSIVPANIAPTSINKTTANNTLTTKEYLPKYLSIKLLKLSK